MKEHNDHHFLNPLILRIEIEDGGSDALKKLVAQLTTNIMKTSEALAIITKTGDQLSKASAELTELIDKLRNTDPDISPEGQAAVERVAAIAQALDDVVPDVTGDPSTPPDVTPIP